MADANPRIAASSYSNTAPLVWSFLYGSNHGKAETILDNAPARSAELLMQDRVDAALVPVIASQFIDGVKLIPGVCVGARDQVRSVCLVTRGADLAEVRSVSLDTSSRSSVVLTKIIFREFLGFEPVWRDAAPNAEAMLASSDAALLIGDPALALSRHPDYRVFDLAGLWHQHTGLGFIFAMWMTRRDRVDIDFAAARDEGVARIPEIAANYASGTGLSQSEVANYLSNNIYYSIEGSMRSGLELYIELAEKNGLIEAARRLEFVD